MSANGYTQMMDDVIILGGDGSQDDPIIFA